MEKLVKNDRPRLWRWEVEHPEYGRAEVKAADLPGALAKAARTWGVRWTSYSFHAFVSARQLSGGAEIYP